MILKCKQTIFYDLIFFREKQKLYIYIPHVTGAAPCAFGRHLISNLKTKNYVNFSSSAD